MSGTNGGYYYNKNIYSVSGDIAPSTAVTRYVKMTAGGSLNIDEGTLFVDATNNRVGIGTITPTYKLDIRGGDLLVNKNNTNENGVLLGDPPGAGYPGIWFGANSATPNYNNYAFLWDQTLGTILNAPAGTQGITYRINNSPVAAVNANGLSVGYGNATSTVPASGTSLIVSGRVGIGRAAPSHPLHLASGAHVTAAGVWTSVSDERLKGHIEEIPYGLETVLKMRPVRYELTQYKEVHIGLIAQDVKSIIPEVVSGVEGDIEAGEILGLSYDNLVPVLIKAVQDLSRDMQALRDEVYELRARGCNATV